MTAKKQFQEVNISYRGAFSPARNEILETRADKFGGEEIRCGYLFSGGGVRDMQFQFKTAAQAKAFQRGLPRWVKVRRES